MPEALKPSEHRAIEKPKIKPDPNLVLQMALDKHAKSSSTLKHSVSRKPSRPQTAK